MTVQPHVAAEASGGREVIQLLYLMQLDENDEGDNQAEGGDRTEESELGRAPVQS